MNFKDNFIKSLAIFVLGVTIVSFGLTGMNSYFPTSEFGHISSPLAYLFQIMFILFIISPPIIAVMLCLIWCELRKRNNLK